MIIHSNVSLSVLLVVFLYGCSDNPKTDLIALKELEAGISRSNHIIVRNTESAYAYLEKKLQNLGSTSAKATLLRPVAKLAQKYSSDIIGSIDSLKEEFNKRTNTGSENNTNNKIVHHFFINELKGKELYQRLKAFTNNMKHVDPLIKGDLKSLTGLAVLSDEIEKNTAEMFVRKYFSQTSVNGAFALLTNFQNKARIIEYTVIKFITDRFTNHWPDHFSFSAIISQSSKYVRAGEEIEIIAGIGDFTRTNQPLIKINGKKIELEWDGAAHYKFKAASKAGKYIIPVKIEYTDHDGKKKWMTKHVDYTVAKE